jgi:predicted AAA+ superfamily ATPase
MFPRQATDQLQRLAHQFKAVAVVGPRQSGKTTLVREVFAGMPYATLESPDTRAFALSDPRGFLAQFPQGAVLDEAQRAPDLFSYLQEVLDSSDARGRFILTGSNHFLLQENIGQSLAGRIAYLNLLPFTLNELPPGTISDPDQWILHGGYPPLFDGRTGRDSWFANYIRTYVERDVRLIRNITDLHAFERFLRLCAGRVGQLLNMSNLAIEAGVDGKTIAGWLGVLESSFIIHLLRPHHINFNKRVVKMPKLYFVDTGLACALLGIRDARTLAMHPFRGALFENAVIAELRKLAGHQGRLTAFHFWRDSKGTEVDLLLEDGGGLTALEIKSGRTVQPELFRGLEQWSALSGTRGGILVHAGDQHQQRSNGVRVLPWNAAGDALHSSTKEH